MTEETQGKPSLGRVLVVDDEHHQRLIMEEAIGSLGFEVTAADSGGQAIDKMKAQYFDVLITDMQMPRMDGIQLLDQALKMDSGISVIVVTAHGTIETAVDAMKKGAEDYLLKPVEFDALEIILKRVFAKRTLVKENRKLQSENDFLKRNIGIRYHLSNTIGKSRQSKELQDQIQHYMKTRDPLLILGDMGVGKNDIARMVHFNGPWANNDLILFDCSAVPEELQEAHLFGEEETMAGDRATRGGLIEKAHLGTLILAQIHKLAKNCQPRISRLIAEEKTQRVGGKRFYQVNVRLIATSNRNDLERTAGKQEFRKDLFDLFLSNTLHVAPLRERKEDIPILAAATAKQMAQTLGKEITKIDPLVIEKLTSYDFPGNYRELRTMVESAVTRCSDTTLKLADFSFPPG